MIVGDDIKTGIDLIVILVCLKVEVGILLSIFNMNEAGIN